jgi:Zn-dependent M28 family amino/carboxypeptidase
MLWMRTPERETSHPFTKSVENARLPGMAWVEADGSAVGVHPGIRNGAYDNVSGCAIMLEIARAFASLETRPARSLLFLPVTGEEKGLLGSEHFSEHPTVPIQSIVGNVNLDMVTMLTPLKKEWRSHIYHAPQDAMTQGINFGAGADMARLNFLLVAMVADAAERPAWNDGDSFGELFAGPADP